MNQTIETARTLLFQAGVPVQELRWVSTLALVALVLLAAWLFYAVLKWVMERVIKRLVEHTETEIDDYLFSSAVRSRVVQILIAVWLYFSLPAVMAQWPRAAVLTTDVTKALMVLAVVMAFNAFMTALYDLLHSRDKSQAGAINNLKEMFQLLSWLVGGVIIVSILAHRSPVFILSGIGASAAVLMLVFRDTILGFVAGIQLNANKMLKPGDWIQAPKFGINGIVTKVGLTTVKVRNYDMSTVTVPPYSLFTESFQNWASMKEKDARRVMRSVLIDVDTVRNLSPDEVAQVCRVTGLTSERAGASTINLSLFRHWLEQLIATFPTSVSDPESYVFSMVRELDPTPEGIPVEMYMFTSVTDWSAYESLQADLLDTVVAGVPHFKLRIYQAPSARSIEALLKNIDK